MAEHLSDNVLSLKKKQKQQKTLSIPVRPVLEMNRETKNNLGIEAQSASSVAV